MQTTMYFTTWRDVYIQNMIMLVSILRFVTSQCSEAHRQACSYPYIQLKAVSATITPADKYVPDYNETTLRNVCDLYVDYNNCSKPFLSTCNKHTVTELHTYDITLGLICTELFNDYLSNRNCFQRLKSSYKFCKDKEMSTVTEINRSSTTYLYILCSSARKYALCVYTATALGCSMGAADVYFNLLNNTISSIYSMNGYQCILRHPMDEISIYTTSSSTTSDARTLSVTTDTIMDTWKRYRKVSSANCNESFHIITYFLFSIFIFGIMQHTLEPLI